MPSTNHDLHGNVPDSSPVALVLIDVINDLEFETGEELARNALPMAERLAALVRRAREARILFTAGDAYMRDLRLVVPADCAAANTREEHEHALAQMRALLKADTTPSAELDLDALIQKGEAAEEAATGADGG